MLVSVTLILWQSHNRLLFSCSCIVYVTFTLLLLQWQIKVFASKDTTKHFSLLLVCSASSQIAISDGTGSGFLHLFFDTEQHYAIMLAFKPEYFAWNNAAAGPWYIMAVIRYTDRLQKACLRMFYVWNRISYWKWTAHCLQIRHFWFLCR